MDAGLFQGIQREALVTLSSEDIVAQDEEPWTGHDVGKSVSSDAAH